MEINILVTNFVKSSYFLLNKKANDFTYKLGESEREGKEKFRL